MGLGRSNITALLKNPSDNIKPVSQCRFPETYLEVKGSARTMHQSFVAIAWTGDGHLLVWTLRREQGETGFTYNRLGWWSSLMIVASLFKHSIVRKNSAEHSYLAYTTSSIINGPLLGLVNFYLCKIIFIIFNYLKIISINFRQGYKPY